MRRLTRLLLASALLAPLACSKEHGTSVTSAPGANEPGTPRERFDTLARDFQREQMLLGNQMQAAKGDEQQKVWMRGMNLGGEFAERFWKLAEENPNDPVAKEAMLWIMQNAPASP